MQTITLGIFGSMCMTHKGCVLLFPTILVLRNSRIHVCSLDHCNVVFYIKISVNKVFSLSVTLRVSYVDLDNCYIRIWRSFDNVRVECKNNIIENVSCLKNSFNNV